MDNFNGLLEVYLHNRIMYGHFHRADVEAVSAVPFLQRIKIIHPHGVLGKYPDVPYSTDLGSTPIDKLCDEIRILFEPDTSHEGFFNQAFKEAHDLLVAAERIFVLGFGFHADNVERFNFFTPNALKDKEVVVTAPFFNRPFEIFMQRIKPYGFSEEHIQKAQCNALFNYVSLE